MPEEPSTGVSAPREALDEKGRRIVLDTLRMFPTGASDVAIIDRLERAGVAPERALELIERLRREGAIHLRQGRWHAMR